MEPIHGGNYREQQVFVLKVICGTAAILHVQSDLSGTSSSHIQRVSVPNKYKY